MYLLATAVLAEVVILAQAADDPSGGWITTLSGLGVAGLLVAYLYLDNQRLRKDLAAERANTLNAETKHIAAIEAAGVERDRLRIDMLARYEALMPLEKEGQRIHTESIKVIEQALALMNQLANRPTLDPRLAEQLIRALDAAPRDR